MKEHLFALCMLLPVAVQAEPELSGFVAAESRVFVEPAQHGGQLGGLQNSILFEPELIWTTASDDEVVFKPFLRLDDKDDKRTHADVRELYWLRSRGDYEVLVGFNKVFWGRAESNHLVDIINQTDLVEDVDGEDKLGQAMVQLAKLTDVGNFRVFILPGFRERTFPGTNGRFRSALPVDKTQTTYDSAARENRIDVALRYEHSFGNWDVGAAHFHGTSREPLLVQRGNVLAPHYDVIDQTSFDAQYTIDAWLWKLEALTRSGQGERFNAVTAGLEYTLFGIYETDADLGFLAEYHRDDRGAKAPGTSLQDDLFFGTRLVLNDVPDTQFLAGVTVDRFTKNRGWFMEASRRLNDYWKVEAEGRVFAGAGDPGSIAFTNDDVIQVRVSRYF